MRGCGARITRDRDPAGGGGGGPPSVGASRGSRLSAIPARLRFRRGDPSRRACRRRAPVNRPPGVIDLPAFHTRGIVMAVVCALLGPFGGYRAWPHVLRSEAELAAVLPR